MDGTIVLITNCHGGETSAVTPNRLSARPLGPLVGLLLREGFADLTIEELASRLHCSKTTLYQLAPSKAELVTVAVRQFFRAATAGSRTASGSLTDQNSR